MAKGFNRPAGGKMGGGGGMMAQLRAMQQQMEEIQARLTEETVSETSGGGAVKVTVTGDQRVKSVEIDPEFLKDADAEMLQDMLLAAMNLALDKSRQLASDRMGPLAGNLPGGLGF